MISQLSPHAREMLATAIARANSRWSAAAASGYSPYLERRQITAPEVRYEPDGTILVPIFALGATASTEVQGLQAIAPDGTKLFTQGMMLKGACCPIGMDGPAIDIILITESYATARTIRMATGDLIPVYVTFSPINLKRVAHSVRESHPEASILLCADGDRSGVEAAVAAASSIRNAYVVTPRFKEKGAARNQSFNALHTSESLEEVNLQLAIALLLLARDALAQVVAGMKRLCLHRTTTMIGDAKPIELRNGPSGDLQELDRDILALIKPH